MGLFDLPRGEVELLMDGKWTSVELSDLRGDEEITATIKALAKDFSKHHTVTAGRYKYDYTNKKEIPVIYWQKED